MGSVDTAHMSRRGFLALGTTAAATVAAASLAGCSPSGEAKADAAKGSGAIDGMAVYADGRVSAPELESSVAVAEPITEYAEELSFDVVVVGAGTTGIPAALAAHEAGAKVAVLQKEANPVAQGMLAARVVKGQSAEAGIAAYIHEMHELNAHQPDMALLKEFADTSEEVLDWYEAKLAEIGFDACKESDSMDHVYEDGNCYVQGLLFSDSMQAPTTALAEQAAKDGVEFFYNTPAVQLAVEDGKVTGVIGFAEDGAYKKFSAAKGVILATGDFQNNDAMLAKYVPDALVFNRKQINKTGDGHLIGLLAGAVMEPGGHSKMIHGGKGCFREEPLLAVNVNGERFMYEDVPYGARNTILRDQPEHRMVTLFDANYSDQIYSWGSDPTVPTVANGTPEKIAAFVEDGTLLQADSIEELAQAAGLPVEATVATVERYNELCELGVDLDFGKASKYMKPVDTPPFYAMPREYAVSAIPAGLLVDVNGQCKNAEGEPIEGLFAAGNCSGPFYGAIDYSLSTMGLSVGRCIVFGYLTGTHVASV
ncbi:FAD-dependent oxidoreductase [Raoultibacter phocaeensis]|uniref:FAD-dependent oxidoreductase n=1 Tax=Raoultibacter phocaeensis TaxID=2479841 RepID=UPI0011195E58|nr:FAD-dependent oxidoreductase [Raoultibacter phocaeensis]